MRWFTIIIILCLLLVPQLIMAQSESDTIIVEMSLDDLKRWDLLTQEYYILKPMVEEQDKAIGELEKSLAIEKKTNELNAREIELLNKTIALKDQEIAMQQRAFADMKEVTDRALKLSETSKPKREWWTIPVMILGAVVAGIALAGGL